MGIAVSNLFQHFIGFIIFEIADKLSGNVVGFLFQELCI
jgi:hypothetical protein